MTVKEIKEKLSDYSDDMEIVRADNCGGYEKIYDVKTDVIKDNFDIKKPVRIAVVLD